MASDLCPTCGTPRVGSFRFCRSCGLDFDATIQSSYRPSIRLGDAPSSSGDHKGQKTKADDTGQARSIAGVLGQDLNTARRRRQLTQAQLGRLVDLSGARIGELERGLGATAPLEVWVRLGETIGRSLAVAFSHGTEPREPDDGLLAVQEVLLDLARQHGRQTDVELPTRPADLGRSIDVVLQDDAARALIIVEVWSRLDDLQAAVDSTSLRLGEALGPAAFAAGSSTPYRVSMCWLLFDGAANRRLVARSWDILESRFPGSSVRWVRCLGSGAPPPTDVGLAWVDPRGRRIVPFRRRRRA